MKKRLITPVLLAGGAGTRLWPLSRMEFPKQLLPMLGGSTMLQATAARAANSARFSAPLVVTSESLRFIVADQLSDRGGHSPAIILEPEGRNTAPAIALAAHYAFAEDPDAVLLVMPSDHIIGRVDAFQAAIDDAMAAVACGYLATFGIKPDRVETGYGYIRPGNEVSGAPGSYGVASFTEKPNPELAAEYLNAGDTLWNSGIFLFRAGLFLDALQSHAPDVASATKLAMAAASYDGHMIRPDPLEFAKSPAISVDYAVMERTAAAAVVPVEMEWSDLGSWAAVWELAEQNPNGTAVQGDVTEVDTANCLLRSDDGPALMALGIQDTIAIATRDAVLIMARDRAQDVRTIIDLLRDRDDDIHRAHTVVHRPWGTYETTDRGDRFLTKRIVVKPGARLSLQMHHHRSEHWIIVSGTAKVTIDGVEKIVHENESTYIPAGATHRLENPGRIPLHLIEVQCGSYLNEDDIVRLEDNYGRAG